MDLTNAFLKSLNVNILLIMNKLHNPPLFSSITSPFKHTLNILSLPTHDYILKLIKAANSNFPKDPLPLSLLILFSLILLMIFLKLYAYLLILVKFPQASNIP